MEFEVGKIVIETIEPITFARSTFDTLNRTHTHTSYTHYSPYSEYILIDYDELLYAVCMACGTYK